MNRVKLSRRQVDYHELKPGEYIQVLKTHYNGQRQWCVLKCPLCGKATSITRYHHDVDYLGDISPGASCPHKPCTFIGWLHLEDWIPEAMGVA